MPPTTRQSHKGVRWAQVQSQRKALSSGLANTRGLPIFPAELLLEIVNHFCSAPIPFAPTNNNPLDPHFGDRSAALRMLSQLCRSLRRNLLPKTWRHLEVCSRNLSLEECKPLRGFRGSIFTPWEKGIATELVKQLEIVTIRNPSLPQYVQIVSVFIGHYSCGGVIAELARCLSLFPNLRTLQIGAVSSVIATLGRLAFKGRTYPTIHTLAIPADHEWFMKSCPGLRHLHIIEDTISFPMDMRGVVKLFGPQLETLGGDLDLRTLADIVTLPNLKVIQLPTSFRGEDLSPPHITLLSGLSSLTAIELSIRARRQNHWQAPPNDDHRDLFSQVGDILKKFFEKDHIRRRARLLTEDGELIDEVVYE